MHRRFASRMHLALAALLLLCAGAFGAAPAAPVPASVPSAPEPIAVADILQRADADERFIQRIATEAQRPDPADRLVAPLETLATHVRELSESYGRDLQSLPALEIESLAGYWNFYDSRLAAWRSELSAITARYSDTAADLATRKAAWEATRAVASARGLPEALIGRIDAILAGIARAEDVLSQRLGRQLALASRATALQEDIDAGRSSVRAALDRLNRRLLTIDAPPLSDVWKDDAPARPVLSTLSVQSRIQQEFLEKYYEAYAWRQRAIAGVALALLALLLWVSNRSKTLESSEPELQSSAIFLRRPVSTWLVLVLLGVLYFDRDAPLVVQELALILAPIPALRILPRRTYTALGGWPYVMTGLYLVYQLGFLVVGMPIVERLYLLATGAATLAALLWFTLRLRSLAKGDVASFSLSRRRAIGGLFVIAIVVAMIANVIGNVSLAEALTRGVILSSYMGLILYAANAMLNGVLKALLAHPAEAGPGAATHHRSALLQNVGWLSNKAAFVIWVVVALKSFRVYQPVADWAGDVLTHPFELGQITITLGSVLLFVASVAVSWWLAKMTRIVLRDEVLPRFELPHGASNSIATLTYYAVATIGLVVALVAAGFEPSQLTIVVGALGVGIGFGLQNIVNNFVSGLILMFERPIQPGDIVEIPGTSGTVQEIGMRATRLRTYEGADVVVPNGTLLSQNLLNWTLTEKTRRLEVNVGVAYGSDLTQVLEILMNAALSAPGVIASPAPSVMLAGMGPNSLDFVVSAWTSDFRNWRTVRSKLGVHVYEAVTAAGIEIPLPQQVLHVRGVSPEAGAKLASAAIFPRCTTG